MIQDIYSAGLQRLSAALTEERWKFMPRRKDIKKDYEELNNKTALDYFGSREKLENSFQTISAGLQLQYLQH